MSERYNPSSEEISSDSERPAEDHFSTGLHERLKNEPDPELEKDHMAVLEPWNADTERREAVCREIVKDPEAEEAVLKDAGFAMLPDLFANFEKNLFDLKKGFENLPE